jgi:hypothetical protein
VANALCGFPGLTVFQVLEEALIPLLYALHDVLNGLRAQLRPPAIFQQLL